MNNHVHESVGGQKTSARFINIPEIVKGNAYNNVYSTDDEDDLSSIISDFMKGSGPNFLEVNIKPGSRKSLGRPSVRPVDNKYTFMQFVQKK